MSDDRNQVQANSSRISKLEHKMELLFITFTDLVEQIKLEQELEDTRE